jgi:Periplasmic binding protein
VVGFIIAGGDLSQALQQANEFGLAQSQELVPFLLFPSHFASLGLDVTKGLIIADSFYADHNDKTRAFAATYMTRFREKVPTSNQVAEYVAVRNYLLAVQAGGTDDGTAVADKLRHMDIDNFGDKTRIRVDGRVMRDLYLLQRRRTSEIRRITSGISFRRCPPIARFWGRSVLWCNDQRTADSGIFSRSIQAMTGLASERSAVDTRGGVARGNAVRTSLCRGAQS